MKKVALSRRIAAGASLLLHVAVLVLLPIADARLELTAGLELTHIESEAAQGCAPHHDDFTCQVCRVLDSAATNEGTDRPIVLVSTHAGPADVEFQSIRRLGCPSALSSRAPPLV